MKITTQQAVSAIHVLNYLYGKELPPVAAYQISLARRQVAPFAEAFDAERAKLAAQYAVKDDDGKAQTKESVMNGVPMTEYVMADQAAFDTAMQPILDQEIEVIVTSVKVESLGNVALPPIVFDTLAWMIEP